MARAQAGNGGRVMKSPQLWSVILLLLATLFLVHARGDVDRVPVSAPLNEVPNTFGSWVGQDIPISAETLSILGKGDFLNRMYTKEGATPLAPRDSSVPPIQLFIAYFPTQRTGQAIHSPQNCLPGSGWTFLSSGVTSFTDETGKTYRVGDYIISDGRYKQEVLYWYQTHGHSIASDYAAKVHMLADSIRLGRTDAALVRVITAIPPDGNLAQAHARLLAFTKHLTPLLPAYVPN